MNRQDRAVYREYQEAMDDGAWELAKRIVHANPDLFRGIIPVVGLLPRFNMVPR